jgi:hypothetical protein
LQQHVFRPAALLSFERGEAFISSPLRGESGSSKKLKRKRSNAADAMVFDLMLRRSPQFAQ